MYIYILYVWKIESYINLEEKKCLGVNRDQQWVSYMIIGSNEGLQRDAWNQRHGQNGFVSIYSELWGSSAMRGELISIEKNQTWKDQACCKRVLGETRLTMMKFRLTMMKFFSQLQD